MSHMQSGSRRHSARLQQKDDHDPQTNAITTNGKTATAAATIKAQTSAANNKKRKNNYDEDDDGFVFSRVKKKKPRVSTNGQPEAPLPLPAITEVQKPAPHSPRNGQRPSKQESDEQDAASAAQPVKRRKRMSFSTPALKDRQPVRRSKRLSSEAQDDRGSPVGRPAQELRPPKIRQDKAEKHKPPAQKAHEPLPQELPKENVHSAQDKTLPQLVPVEETHSSTKISLPFADTPVISRNKAMRDRKSGKGERRSSLGLRGRRASSLIDSGTSNGML